MKVLRYLLSLITIVAGQHATAQDISTLDFADTYWEEIHDENTVTIAPGNKHFQVIENCIVGKTQEARKLLHQE